MAKSKSDDAQQTSSNWMRNRMTIEYLGLWEGLYNPDFKPLEFEGFRKDVGLNSFMMSPSEWIDRVHFIPQLVRPATGERYASPIPSYQHFSAMGSDPIETCYAARSELRCEKCASRFDEMREAS